MEKLILMNTNDKLVNTIRWLYANTKIQVNQKEINIGRGVIQGGILSPTLFLVMFNDLLEIIEEEDFEEFAFADDLAINGKGEE